jgi:hypothetical protein
VGKGAWLAQITIDFVVLCGPPVVPRQRLHSHEGPDERALASASASASASARAGEPKTSGLPGISF